MNVYLCLAVCCLPFVISFVCFRLFSEIRISTEIAASLAGLLAVLPITFIQFLISDVLFAGRLDSAAVLPLFGKAMLLNGLIEESVKMLFLLFVPRKKISFNSFFLASLLCGLCLGCFETSVYFLQHLQSASDRGAELLYHLIFIRIFSSDVIHLLCTGLCGIFMWSCISKQPDISAFVFAVLSHGLFDFFAGFQSYIRWFSVVVILFLLIETRIHYEKNKPAEPYKKDAAPSKTSRDVTVESALKDAPEYMPEK